MPDTPRDDLPSVDFDTLLDDMLARVAAAARAAHESRLQASADAVAGVSPIEADSECSRVRVDSANAELALPGCPDAPEQDNADSSGGVWADTTPFGPVDPPEWLDPSSTGSLVAPTARAPNSAHPRGWTRPVSLAAVAFVTVTLAGLGVHHAIPTAAPPAQPTSLDSLPPTSAGRVPAAAATARNASPGGPALHIAIDADASTESRMLDELRRSVGSQGGAADALGPSTFAIARYDALPAASADWQVVATLGTEEVYALVPTGSPLRHLGDLRGRRINVGPDGSARAVSGAALYRTLFGASPPRSNSSALPRDDALRQMLAAGELDAVLLFDGQPSSWFAALPESTRHALRLLRLDPGDPAGRRALQRYLPARLAPGVDKDGVPVPTLREVTFLIAPASARNVAPVLRALCDHLPALRVDGHPKWREVDPALSLPIGLQRPAQLDAILTTCAPARPVSSINRRTS